MSNNLDPDHCVRPNLGPNCLRSYQQTALVGKEFKQINTNLVRNSITASPRNSNLSLWGISDFLSFLYPYVDMIFMSVVNPTI